MQIFAFWLGYSILSFFLTSKTISFYIFFEIALIPTVLLVLFYGYQPEKLQSSMYLLVYTVTASLPLLVLFLIRPIFFSSFVLTSSSWFTICISLAFIVKTPLYLVHVWLPKAHVEAPVAGSIVLAGILLKIGSYGLIVFMPFVFNNFLLIYLSLSVLGSIYCSLICLRIWDTKGLIAYSRVVHMGVVSIGIIRGYELGYFCALIIVVAHGFTSTILFALAFDVYVWSHTRVINTNKGVLGLPVLAFIIFILLAINFGVPPTINLWREIFLFARILNFSLFTIPFLLIAALVGFLYNVFLYVSLSQQKESYNRREDVVAFPFINSAICSFLFIAYLSGFFGPFLISISIKITLFRLSPYLVEVTGDMYRTQNFIFFLLVNPSPSKNS